jgi:Ca2+/H+ antiporter, TMEM165/GDT1 family
VEASSFVTYKLPQAVQVNRFSHPPLVIETKLIETKLIETEQMQVEPVPEAELPDNQRLSTVIMVEASPMTASESSQTVEPATNSQFWKVFGSTFITIFLAELGDKTQVATLLMTAESHAPWVVFTGAAAALLTTSLLGVLVGQWLSSRVSPKTLDTAAGITLALISVWLLVEVVSL